eukprot:65619_1
MLNVSEYGNEEKEDFLRHTFSYEEKEQICGFDEHGRLVPTMFTDNIELKDCIIHKDYGEQQKVSWALAQPKNQISHEDKLFIANHRIFAENYLAALHTMIQSENKKFWTLWWVIAIDFDGNKIVANMSYISTEELFRLTHNVAGMEEKIKTKRDEIKALAKAQIKTEGSRKLLKPHKIDRLFNRILVEFRNYNS